MAYTPRQFSGQKGVHGNNSGATKQELYEVIGFLENELVAISRALLEFGEVELRTVKRAPKRPADGMIVSADGTSWDPGSGKGIYAYLSGAWVLLGGSGLTANTANTPFYVVDQEARDMLRALLVEAKLHTLMWSTSLNFSADLDPIRGTYYNVLYH